MMCFVYHSLLFICSEIYVYLACKNYIHVTILKLLKHNEKGVVVFYPCTNQIPVFVSFIEVECIYILYAVLFVIFECIYTGTQCM